MTKTHFWGGFFIPCVSALPHEKVSYYSSLSHIHSLSGNTRWGETGKRGGHGQNWTQKNQSSTLILFDANKVLVYIHSIQDCDGQETTMYSGDCQLTTKGVAHVRCTSCTSTIAHRFRVPNNTNVRVCALCLCAPQKPLCSVFVAPQTATYIDEQRRALGDAFVLAVFAEYAGPSTGSGDHPQQYYLHQFCTGAVQGAFTASHARQLPRKSLFLDSFFSALSFGDEGG